MIHFFLECGEYAKLTFSSTFSNTLSLNAKRIVATSKCKDVTQLIIGGKRTFNGEFPHMAAIGWKILNELDFKCGGSLISESFVLTAAHCATSNNPPSVVRLGDQNIFSRRDGLYESTIDIQQSIIHEKYERGKNDIAVLKLAKKASFTDYIRPACLWQTTEIDTDRVTTIGWGKTETGRTSNELLKVGLDIIPNQECQSIWAKAGLPNFVISDTQMCAGDKKGGKDTCNGDSGGPMTITKKDNNCLFYVVGE